MVYAQIKPLALIDPVIVYYPCFFKHVVSSLIPRFALRHNIWILTAAGCTRTRFLLRELSINVQDEWTEMCKRNVRESMIAGHESEKEMKKNDRGERRDMGSPSLNTKKDTRIKHLTCTQKTGRGTVSVDGSHPKCETNLTCVHCQYCLPCCAPPGP